MRYDRQCQSCGHLEETVEPMLDTAPKECPSCKEPKFIRIVTTVPEVLFKGHGWPGKEIEAERKYKFNANPKKPT